MLILEQNFFNRTFKKYILSMKKQKTIIKSQIVMGNIFQTLKLLIKKTVFLHIYFRYNS